MALEIANRLEQGRRRLGVAEEAPIAASLPDIWEELITEQQLFSQSSASPKQSWQGCFQTRATLIQPLSGTMNLAFCLEKCDIAFSGIFSRMDPFRENDKTAGSALLKINLKQSSFDNWLILQSCLFLISFPCVRNSKVKSSKVAHYAISPSFQLPNLSEDFSKKTLMKIHSSCFIQT